MEVIIYTHTCRPGKSSSSSMSDSTIVTSSSRETP